MHPVFLPCLYFHASISTLVLLLSNFFPVVDQPKFYSGLTSTLLLLWYCSVLYCFCSAFTLFLTWYNSTPILFLYRFFYAFSLLLLCFFMHWPCFWSSSALHLFWFSPKSVPPLFRFDPAFLLSLPRFCSTSILLSEQLFLWFWSAFALLFCRFCSASCLLLPSICLSPDLFLCCFRTASALLRYSFEPV